MTKEQEAIEYLKQFSELMKKWEATEIFSNIETVLNMLKVKDTQIDFYKKGLEREIESNRDNVMETIEKDKEIENITTNYKNLIADVSGIAKELGLEEDGTIDEIYAEIKKRDKIITLLAKAFKQDDVRSVEEIKQYFERKAEDVKN